jgi:hypothetical protein
MRQRVSKMKITIDVDDNLIQKAKDAAAENHSSLDELMAAVILVELERLRRARTRGKFKMITYGAGGVFPGVDIDSMSALLDIMDGIDADKD